MFLFLTFFVYICSVGLEQLVDIVLCVCKSFRKSYQNSVVFLFNAILILKRNLQNGFTFKRKASREA